METKITPFEQLTITNKFMFAMVFSHKEIAKPFLEAVLGIKIHELREPEPEKTIDVNPATKGVRFDVFVKESGTDGETLRSFDIETSIKSLQAMKTGKISSHQKKEKPKSISWEGMRRFIVLNSKLTIWES